MTMLHRFCGYALRTLDVPAARSFYDTLLGPEERQIVPLHAEAVARGARPHWLGVIEVNDAEQCASAFEAHGAVRLGPTRTGTGGTLAVVRDPGGAVVGLASGGTSGAPAGEPVWRVLNSGDVERTMAAYRELFGWHFGSALELDSLGRFHPFAWTSSSKTVGAICDIRERSGVHPHWLFHFAVPALDHALAEVRRLGGLTLPPLVAPNGARVGVCDDPQGAAFALWEGPEND